MVHSLVTLIADGKYQEDDIDGKNTIIPFKCHIEIS